MTARFTRRLRATALVAPLLAVIGFCPSSKAAITVGSGNRDSSPSEQSWTLADGTRLRASITEYNLKTRLVSLRQSNGNLLRISPRDLTAMSKLKWLTSAAFMDAIQNYEAPRGALPVFIKRASLPLLGLLLGLFLAFWLGAAAVSGERKIAPALGAYFKSLLWAVTVLLLTAFALRAVADSFGASPMAPFFQALLVGVALLSILGLASFQVGSGYGLDGGSGIGAVMLGAAIAFSVSVFTFYVVPRFLQRPGIDDWFTDRLLSPLGLA